MLRFLGSMPSFLEGVCVRGKRWMRGRDGKRERERGSSHLLRGSFDAYSAREVHAERPIDYESYRRKEEEIRTDYP